MKLKVSLLGSALTITPPDYDKYPKLDVFRPENNHKILFALSHQVVDASKEQPFYRVDASRWDTDLRRVRPAQYKGIDLHMNWQLADNFNLGILDVISAIDNMEKPFEKRNKIPADLQLLICVVAETITEKGEGTNAVVATGSIPLFAREPQDVMKDDKGLEYTIPVSFGLTDYAALATLNEKSIPENEFVQQREQYKKNCVEKGSLSVGQLKVSLINDKGVELDIDGVWRETLKGKTGKTAKRLLWIEKSDKNYGSMEHVRSQYISVSKVLNQKNWRNINKHTDYVTKVLLQEIDDLFDCELLPESKRMNVPYYAHLHPVEGELTNFPSFVALDSSAYPSCDMEQIVRLLHTAIDLENMTVDRFVRVVANQQENRTPDRPRKDFYRCVLVAFTALQMAVMSRAFLPDGSNFRTRAKSHHFRQHYDEDIRNKLDEIKKKALAGDVEGVGKLDPLYQVFTDQLASWGTSVETGADCDDGLLVVSQLYKLVIEKLLDKEGVSNDLTEKFPELFCWAWILNLFVCLPSTLRCQNINDEGKVQCHKVNLPMDKATFFEAVGKGAAYKIKAMLKQKKKGKDAADSDPEVVVVDHNLRDLGPATSSELEGIRNICLGRFTNMDTTYPWLRQMGLFNIETTTWQTPSLLPVGYRTSPNILNKTRANRISSVIAYMRAAGKASVDFLNTGATLKNLHPVNNGNLNDLVTDPINNRAYSFYQLAISCDVPLQTALQACNPKFISFDDSDKTSLLNGRVFTSLMFQSEKRIEESRGRLSMGAFLQELAINTKDIVLVPCGSSVPVHHWLSLNKTWSDFQWPSTYFNVSSVKLQQFTDDTKQGNNERMVFVERPVIELNPSPKTGDTFLNTAARIRGFIELLLGEMIDSEVPVMAAKPMLLPPVDVYKTTRRWIDVSNIAVEATVTKTDPNGEPIKKKIMARDNDRNMIDVSKCICLEFILRPGQLQNTILLNRLSALLIKMHSQNKNIYSDPYDLLGFYFKRYNTGVVSRPKSAEFGRQVLVRTDLSKLLEEEELPLVVDDSRYFYVVRIFLAEIVKMYHDV